jgi:hypothetical protein
MTRKEAVNYLHKNMKYSRRMSAKLVDLAILSKSSKPFGIAIEVAVTDATGVIEKAAFKPKKKKKEEAKRFIATPTQPDVGIGRVGFRG